MPSTKQGIGGLLAAYAGWRALKALTQLQVISTWESSFYEATFYLAGMGWAAHTHVVIALACAFMAVLVWIKKPYSRTALISLHCLISGWCLLWLYAGMQAHGRDPIVDGIIGQAGAAFIFECGGLLYVLLSRRVKNTYGVLPFREILGNRSDPEPARF